MKLEITVNREKLIEYIEDCKQTDQEASLEEFINQLEDEVLYRFPNISPHIDVVFQLGTTLYDDMTEFQFPDDKERSEDYDFMEQVEEVVDSLLEEKEWIVMKGGEV